MAMMPAAQRRSQVPVLEIAGVLMLLAATVLLVAQLGRFSAVRQKMPASLIMAGIPVSGLSPAEAQAYIEQVYGAPVTVLYRDQELRLDPAQVGFRVNSQAMLAQADERRTEGTFWSGFWDFLWLRDEQTVQVDLIAEHSDELLRAWLSDVAARYDRPPLPAQPALETLSFVSGQPGYTLDQEASAEAVAAALRKPAGRRVDLVVREDSGSRPGLETLRSLLVQYVAAEQFTGVVSVYVIDLKTGEEMELNIDNRGGTPSYLNCEVAYASTSTMKIPIMVGFFRYLDWEPTPGSDDYKNLLETMTLSGNVSANAMLYKIGFEDAQVGSETITQMEQYLGMTNTFMAAPFIVDPNEELGEIPYISTPAREAARAGQCVDTRPDPAAQTTVKDLALILDMIYQCAEYSGGTLLAAYPDEITPDECRMMIDFLAQNEEAPLIRAGVPVDTRVAHKHGWTYDTHGDAGIVFSPGGDYVLTMFLWADTDWMPIVLSFPVMEGISTATFNYFNPDLVSVPRRGQADVLGTDSGG